MERRLAAILAADVVGYSRLMEADEEATARTLSTYREITEVLVVSHHGRVFGSTEVFECPQCDRIHWPGSHVRRMHKRLRRWQGAQESHTSSS